MIVSTINTWRTSPLKKTVSPEHTLQIIQELIQRTNGDSDVFAETLRREKIPHLSFSQVSCVESCRQRYYLQYILGQDPQPTPEYFTKGKLFHNLLAAYYRRNGNRSNTEPGLDDDSVFAGWEAAHSHLSPGSRVHLENAYRVHLHYSWKDSQVIAVEQPFVMLVDPGLPPLVGVIDLVLKQDSTTIIVDHKTGRDFYPQDELQGAIYSEYMRREFGSESRSTFYYDHYRWVDNLQRIRKPALQRTPIASTADYWPQALERIRRGYRLIEQVTRDGRGTRGGQCFRCPYRGDCWENG